MKVKEKRKKKKLMVVDVEVRTKGKEELESEKKNVSVTMECGRYHHWINSASMDGKHVPFDPQTEILCPRVAQSLVNCPINKMIFFYEINS